MFLIHYVLTGVRGTALSDGIPTTRVELGLASDYLCSTIELH
jgi:hypothetical protein